MTCLRESCVGVCDTLSDKQASAGGRIGYGLFHRVGKGRVGDTQPGIRRYRHWDLVGLQMTASQFPSESERIARIA
jgi:hypothetical protein